MLALTNLVRMTAESFQTLARNMENNASLVNVVAPLADIRRLRKSMNKSGAWKTRFVFGFLFCFPLLL